jgi:uncharacterized membrane protein YcaP (DUF421 family)
LIAYAAVVVFLRMSGKRTLAKMNAFDLVVTVALGSTLAAVITSKTLALADGLLALALLIGMQYAVAWVTVRSRWFEQIVKSEPAALLRHGRFLDDAMRRERISNDEVLAAIRTAGLDDRERVALVVLETDGTMNVLRIDQEAAALPATRDVVHPE